MFVFINPIVQKRKIRKTIYPQRVEMGDRYYFSQKLPIIKGVPQWQGLVSCGKLLLPRGLEPPGGVDVFGGYEWQLILAAEKLKLRLQKEKCDLIFFDRDGSHSGLLIPLAQLARNTAVISDNAAFYLGFTEEIYPRLGCYIQVNSVLGLMGGYAFVTEREEVDIRGDFRVITVNSLCESDITIPLEYSRYTPENVSKCGFSEALYSACGVGRLRDYIIRKKYDL